MFPVPKQADRRLAPALALGHATRRAQPLHTSLPLRSFICASWLALGVRKRDVKAYNAKGQGDSRSWSRLDTFRPRGQPS